MVSALEPKYGKPVWGKKGTQLTPIPDKPVPPEVLAALKHLLRAGKAKTIAPH